MLTQLNNLEKARNKDRAAQLAVIQKQTVEQRKTLARTAIIVGDYIIAGLLAENFSEELEIDMLKVLKEMVAYEAQELAKMS
jgi:ABC-type cobalamin/Fe3+-siderophores transport system ATPase subunit